MSSTGEDEHFPLPKAKKLKIDPSEWKKKIPLFYDFIISHPLPSYSNTVDWSTLSPRPHNQEPSFTLHTLLFNTYKYSTTSSSFLTIADVPFLITNDDPVSIMPKVEVTRNIVLDELLNVARFMPQNPNIVCAKTSSIYTPDIFVFDCTRHQEGTGDNDHFDPDLRLTGLSLNVFGRSALAWHPNKEGYILGSNGNTICLWDINAALAQHNRVLGSVHAYEYRNRSSVVKDVQWNCKNESLFGSVGHRGQLVIWDLRTNQPELAAEDEDFMEMNSLSFNPNNDWLLATASSNENENVCLFDIRKLAEKLHSFIGHDTEKVIQVEWDPHHELVLASSGGVDRKVIIWDTKRIGDAISAEEENAPELLFSHTAHMDTIREFSWNKHEPWVISSVSKDKTLHVWKLAKSISQKATTDDCTIQ